jgi:hypothetical protein
MGLWTRLEQHRAAVVGNEDGAAHHVNAEVYQGLADVGFTIPASGAAYWIGEAYGSVDFNDLDEVPEKTASAVATAVGQAVHLATRPTCDGARLSLSTSGGPRPGGNAESPGRGDAVRATRFDGLMVWHCLQDPCGVAWLGRTG